MTTEDNDAGERLVRLNENLAKVEALSQRLVAALGRRRAVDNSLHGPAPDVYMKAAAAYLA
ncbi:MAG: class poly(R)-hydroxyalkanoic acid synthase, partial [Pseudomonadota bacterium]